MDADKRARAAVVPAGRGFLLPIAMLAWVLNGNTLCGESATRVDIAPKRISVVFPGAQVAEQHLAIEPGGEITLLAVPTPGNETPNAGVSPQAIPVGMHWLNRNGETFVALDVERQLVSKASWAHPKGEALVLFLVRATNQDLAARGPRVKIGGAEGYRFSTEERGGWADVFVFDTGAHRYAFYVLFDSGEDPNPGKRFFSSISVQR